MGKEGGRVITKESGRHYMGFETGMNPPDGEYELHGSHYKIGAHGFVYLWRDGEWMTSTKEKWELENPQPSTGAICHKVYGMNNEN